MLKAFDLQHYVPNLSLEVLDHNKQASDNNKINLEGFLAGALLLTTPHYIYLLIFLKFFPIGQV